MHLTLLCVLFLAPSVLADGWEDFTNNIATDLVNYKAPLITLFGERLTKQFLSESISLMDNVIFALSPLGVLTAVVSVIRVCGGSSLRAFVGRAQEGPAEAESELLPCVSESTAELFNEGGISRVFGQPKIVEIVEWENENAKVGEQTTEIGTLREALKKGAWSAKKSGLSAEDVCDLTDLPELDIPNLSLNKGIKRRNKRWFHCAAILGAVMQIGVMAYAAITVFVFPGSFEKDGKAVPSYAFPFYIIGTIFLFTGMLSCAIIIERSSMKYYFTPNKPSTLYWLQPGNQHVGDQVFDAFLAVKEESTSEEMEYIKSRRVRKYDNQTPVVYLALFFTMIGFIIQFIGLRGLHASVILAQLGSTFTMSVLRSCLRTERMKPDENRLKDERELTARKQQELDCFAFHLDHIASFDLLSSPSQETSSSESLSERIFQTDESLIRQVIHKRTRLAELTADSNLGLKTRWDNMPIRKVAHNLSNVIETIMDLMSSWGVEFGETFEFRLNLECQSSIEPYTWSRSAYSIEIRRCGDALKWKINEHELEAILGLWVWSLSKSDKGWRKPLSRMIGLTRDEAGKEETYLHFHKWIFRQTEASMVSSNMIDSSRRFFGFEPDIYSDERDILVVRTENEVEIMAAQDLFIHFLQHAFRHFNALGGDTDILTGLQNPFLAQNSRVEEMMHCFERNSLGSREDALLCIMPILRQQGLLPELSADTTHPRRRMEGLIQKHDWKGAFQLVRWICQRSEGAEFERSVYELGCLCRRALLNASKAAQEEGFESTCRILDSNIGKDFFDAQRMSPHESWSKSPCSQQWWTKFAQQVGWVAWHISINATGMKWMQPALERRGIGVNLHPQAEIGQSIDDTQMGAKAMKGWLTFNHIDFDREYSGLEDPMGYKWALTGGHYALLYFTLERWVEIGADFPCIIQHAYALAAKNHCDWGIKVLLRHDANIDTLNERNISALVDVVAIEDLDAARILLENGANPNGDEQFPNSRPLILAARQGATDIVCLLLDCGATPEITDRSGSTALHWAIREDRLDTVRFLLSKGVEIEKSGFDGVRPLHTAVVGRQFQMTQLLLESHADINAPDGLGMTALMLAAKSSVIDVIHLLLARGADIHLRDLGGRSALDWARQNQYYDAAAILEGVPGEAELEQV
ncbi:uncharacterized protein N7482_009805 [Penicillium canariense]|uniref:Uncharacterized protein n=1 Tax=Penicillium canariense TaxID=189055 RepID=A0A9W9HQM3_9EURO|nr:uncharacterized protein N7482_009805 [Penicillium canariense]KAJ5153327.1 hypothetical protein N7482_009805 [Penicillium canariense]